MKTIFDYMGMYKHFGNIEENIPVNIFLSPDFAKCHPYVIGIRIKWLTDLDSLKVQNFVMIFIIHFLSLCKIHTFMTKR